MRARRYLDYLDSGPHSVSLATSDLAPSTAKTNPERTRIRGLSYTLWPFQEQILAEMGDSTLILGLPTGLGKTYLARAKLYEESKERTIRVRACRLSACSCFPRAR